jgi:hypothetical protein
LECVPYSFLSQAELFLAFPLPLPLDQKQQLQHGVSLLLRKLSSFTLIEECGVQFHMFAGRCLFVCFVLSVINFKLESFFIEYFKLKPLILKSSVGFSLVLSLFLLAIRQEWRVHAQLEVVQVHEAVLSSKDLLPLQVLLCELLIILRLEGYPLDFE